jgi:hypothetical protein
VLTCSSPTADSLAPSEAQSPLAEKPVQRPVLELPPEKRRPLSSRIDDIVADPRASACREDCPICSKLKPETANAALLVWDDLARSGVWPVESLAIFKFLRSNNLAGGEGAGHKRVRQFLAHRRMSVLHAHVRKDKKRWGVLPSLGEGT